MTKYSRLQKCKFFFALVFSFLLGCTLTINLLPIDKTCQLTNTDREFNIMNDSKLKSPELIILILSAPLNFNRRNAIRETWLKLHDRDRTVESAKLGNAKHYFVVGGLGLNSMQVRGINDEQLKHNDILILPLIDSFTNLTYKVLKSFEWLNEQYDFGLTYKYVLKCDDDSFVRLDSLMHEMSHLELIYIKSGSVPVNDISSPYLRVNFQANRFVPGEVEFYWGYFKGNARIKSSGKYKENNWILCDSYLPYAQGGGYILSKNLVTYIAQNANYFRLYNSEDVSVGLWLSSVNNVLRIHDRRFDTEWTTRGCQNDYLISHKLSEKQIRAMYESIISTKNLCDRVELTRTYYMYNWSALPSKCCNKGTE